MKLQLSSALFAAVFVQYSTSESPNPERISFRKQINGSASRKLQTTVAPITTTAAPGATTAAPGATTATPGTTTISTMTDDAPSDDVAVTEDEGSEVEHYMPQSTVPVHMGSKSSKTVHAAHVQAGDPHAAPVNYGAKSSKYNKLSEPSEPMSVPMHTLNITHIAVAPKSGKSKSSKKGHEGSMMSHPVHPLPTLPNSGKSGKHEHYVVHPHSMPLEAKATKIDKHSSMSILTHPHSKQHPKHTHPKVAHHPTHDHGAKAGKIPKYSEALDPNSSMSIPQDEHTVTVVYEKKSAKSQKSGKNKHKNHPKALKDQVHHSLSMPAMHHNSTQLPVAVYSDSKSSKMKKVEGASSTGGTGLSLPGAESSPPLKKAAKANKKKKDKHSHNTMEAMNAAVETTDAGEDKEMKTETQPVSSTTLTVGLDEIEALVGSTTGSSGTTVSPKSDTLTMESADSASSNSPGTPEKALSPRGSGGSGSGSGSVMDKLSEAADLKKTLGENKHEGNKMTQSDLEELKNHHATGESRTESLTTSNSSSGPLLIVVSGISGAVCLAAVVHSISFWL